VGPEVERPEVKLPTRLDQMSRVRMRGALLLPPPHISS